MIPAKNRDRKCSTCRHYQPSPLWRKGWCRNPLLYDRNTNHLVEGDSLACNRTFIDYWEPMTGPAPGVAPQARSTKPRIAPSIPMDTMDSQGNRDVVTGNTPMGGMAATAPSPNYTKPTPNRALREPPKLSIVTPDFEPMTRPGTDSASKVTRQIEQVPAAVPEDEATAETAAQRIKAARKQRSLLPAGRNGRIIMLLGALVLLAALGGGAFLLSKQPRVVPAVIPTVVATRPAPTPTGLGDATATSPPSAPTVTIAPPPANVIGVNGWVQVKAVGGLTLRDAAGKAGAKIMVLANGSTAHVVEGPKSADGFTWWRLDRVDPKNPAVTGWCAGQFLAPIPAPAP